MRDEYIIGRVSRLSPEAPVPILEPTEKLEMSGGAANVYEHFKAFGYEATLFSRDAWPVKTRYLDESGHHLLRMDRDYQDAPVFDQWQELREAVTRADAFVVSDYHKGTVPLMPWPCPTAPVMVADAKAQLRRFDGFSAVKCNADADMTDAPHDLIITKGAAGCVWQGRHFNGCEVPVADVTGAGDTFTAWLARGLLEGMTMPDILIRCNRAAAEAVRHRGTYVVGEI